MIDRKTLMISATFIVVTLAAAIWRIAILPDWTLFPISGGSTSTHSYKALGLFIGPLWVVAFTGILSMRGFSRNSKEELQPWKNQGDLMLIVCGALVTAMQFFAIARSFGMATSLDRIAVSRAGFVLLGALMIIIGNQLPKLPWLQFRIKLLEMDSVQGAKLLRFNGWIMVAFGIGLVVSASILPARLLFPAISVIWIAGFSLMMFRRIQLKREQLR